MAGTDPEVREQPLVQPRVIRFLKERPRLVDYGVRREFLEEVEKGVVERRRPDTAAERFVENIRNRIGNAGGTVAKERTKRVAERANEGPLRDV